MVVNDIVKMPEFDEVFKRKAALFKKNQNTRGEIFIPEELLNNVEKFKVEYLSACRFNGTSQWKRFINIVWLGGSCAMETIRRVIGVYGNTSTREKTPRSEPLTFL